MSTKDRISYFVVVVFFVVSTLITMYSEHKVLAWISLVIATILSVIVYFVLTRRTPTPETQLHINNDLFRYFLSGIEHDYMFHFDSSGRKRPNIRLNVMVPRQGDVHSWERPLKIVYWKGEYGEAERRVPWAPGDGKCGQAFRQARVVIWAQDLPQTDDDSSEKPMPKDYERKFEKPGTVLSAAVTSVRDDKIVYLGVLNMDSLENNAITDVKNPLVQNLFRDAAHQVASLVPEEGIVW
jgi:hypothetical protein